MELTTIAVSIPFFFLTGTTGLLVNLIQGACYLFIRPLSKSLFRRINGAVAEIFWLEILWLYEWWSGFKVQLYTDSETYGLMGKEHALLMPNHISDTDTHIGWLLAQRSGCLRSALTVVKKTTQYLPIYGWAIWFFEFVFLDRSWEKDEKYLKSTLLGLKDFPKPFWLTIFVEGTRMTPDKLLEAQAFAASRGLPMPRNVMVPRIKGFVSAVQNLRSFVPAVYDVTLAVPKGHPTPSLMRALKGQPCVIKVHIKRYSMKDLPESDSDIAQWCRDRFVAKDDMLDKFLVDGTFQSLKIQDTGRSLQSLFACTSCSSLICIGTFKFCQMFSLLSTWKGNAILAGVLAAVAVLAHIFIEYTKPKRAEINSCGTRK